jgi:WhiB family redox-sensing transcriptional regulator
MMIHETLEIIRLDSPLWMARGLCGKGEYDPEDWFTDPDKPEVNEQRRRRATAVCRQCPVRYECLAWSYETDENFAICGGLTPSQRKRVRHRMQRRLMDDLGIDE